MVAAKTNLPVIGVPVQSKALNGLDSLLSIAQMPGGVQLQLLQLVKPVQRMLDYLPRQILGSFHDDIHDALELRREAIEKMCVKVVS